jgi:hypothetical protein
VPFSHALHHIAAWNDALPAGIENKMFTFTSKLVNETSHLSLDTEKALIILEWQRLFWNDI